MLNEEEVQPTTPSFWQSLQRLLVEPHAPLADTNAWQEARLVSIISSLLIIVGLTGTIIAVLTDSSTINVFVLPGLAIIAFVAYALSRTKLYKFSGYLIAWALVFIAYWAGDANKLSTSIYTYLTLAFVIASATFPFRQMFFFVAVNMIVLGLMPLFYPGYTESGALLGLFIPVSLLTLAIVRHQEKVEHDRLANTKELNQELLSLQSDLENNLKEQTARSEEQARQVQVITEVARTAASFQDLDRLLTSSTRLISDSFGFYHVGIFLLDDDGQYAVLRAANSEGGQRMLGRMHTLPVDLNSIVGYTAKTHTPRIALDTGEDAVYFNNPDLPETRSEIALPLKVGMRLIGILDVQSIHKNAFSNEDIAILTTLGDQLAIAIDNTRLLTETRRALIAAEQTHQRYFNQAWSQFAPRMDIEGYRYHDGRLIPISERTAEERGKENKDRQLTIPLMVRGQKIGVLDIQPTNGKQDWNPDEIAVLEAAAERTALALESARLLQDAQRRAAKESIISEISSRMSEESAIDKIMSATVSELQRLLDASEVTLRIDNRE